LHGRIVLAVFFWAIIPVTPVLIPNTIAVSEAAEADGESNTVFDKVWSSATLYENEDNRFIEKVVLKGITYKTDEPCISL